MAGVIFAKRNLLHEKDPADVIFDSIGREAVEAYDVMHNLVLVGVYQAPEKTSGGIIRTDTSKKEDVHQGIAGLVLKAGPAAFVDDEHNKFHGKSVSPGDWIVYRPSDCWLTSINGVPVRVVEDSKVKAKIPHPDMVF